MISCNVKNFQFSVTYDGLYSGVAMNGINLEIIHLFNVWVDLMHLKVNLMMKLV